jgi:hypothetical protein
MTYLTEPGWAAAPPVHRTSQQIRYYVGLLVGRARFLEGVARICDVAGVEWEWTSGREFPCFRPVVITLHGADGDLRQARREIATWAAAFRPIGG